MTAYQGQLATLTLPEFGLPRVEPAIPATVYRKRMASFRQRVHADGYDVAIVYGDREHFANLTYLTGYDPRFEEAMLIVDLNGSSKPLLVVGNEGYGYVPISPVAGDFEPVLFQSFSLLGQDRSRSRKLTEILRDGGVTSGAQVGVAGWKYFSAQESGKPLSFISSTTSYSVMPGWMLNRTLRTACELNVAAYSNRASCSTSLIARNPWLLIKIAVALRMDAGLPVRVRRVSAR